MLALRKKTDLKYGTQKETTARSAVATKVTMKPGVAGRRQPIFRCGGGKNIRESSSNYVKWGIRKEKKMVVVAI